MRNLLKILLLAIILVGCSTIATRRGFYEPITAELRSGNLDAAIDGIEAAKESHKYSEKDRLLYFLDAGLLNHFGGRYQVSNDKLHLAEAAAEELFTKSVSRAAASLLLNDNILEYAGEDYEILYINLIKALNYVELGSFDEAFVEIRRANLKLDLLEQKYVDMAEQYRVGAPDDTNKVEIDYTVDRVRFHNDAFARYLSMHMYAAEGKMDDARIDYDFLTDAFRDQPYIYDFPLPDVKYYSEDKAIVSVVGFAGLAPLKQPLNLRIRTDKDLNLVQVLYDDPARKGAEYGHFPVDVSADYYFKFAIPQLVTRPSQVTAVKVVADGESLGELQLIENVGMVAEETFAAKKSLIYIRSVARAIVKGLAAHRLKKKVDTGGLGGWLKKAAVDVGHDVIENADLRSSQYLPGMVYVGDFEVPEGTHNITVEFYGIDGNLLSQTTRGDYNVLGRGFNLISAYTVQ